MQIKLYIDNDSRPRGSYANVQHAEEWANQLIFRSSSGNTYHTNLRYLLLVEEGDKVTTEKGYMEVIGRTKPLRSKTVGGQNEMFRHEQDDFDDHPSRG